MMPKTGSPTQAATSGTSPWSCQSAAAGRDDGVGRRQSDADRPPSQPGPPGGHPTWPRPLGEEPHSRERAAFDAATELHGASLSLLARGQSCLPGNCLLSNVPTIFPCRAQGNKRVRRLSAPLRSRSVHCSSPSTELGAQEVPGKCFLDT